MKTNAPTGDSYICYVWKSRHQEKNAQAPYTSRILLWHLFWPPPTVATSVRNVGCKRLTWNSKANGCFLVPGSYVVSIFEVCCVVETWCWGKWITWLGKKRPCVIDTARKFHMEMLPSQKETDRRPTIISHWRAVKLPGCRCSPLRKPNSRCYGCFTYGKGGVHLVIFTVGCATGIVFVGCHILLILLKGTCCTSILGIVTLYLGYLLKSKPILIGRHSVARSQKIPPVVSQ